MGFVQRSYSIYSRMGVEPRRVAQRSKYPMFEGCGSEATRNLEDRVLGPFR